MSPSAFPARIATPGCPPNSTIGRHSCVFLRSAIGQTIRLLFDEPQELRRISLVFEEDEMMRTQEFVMRWSSDPGGPFREIARQQWNFSAPE